MAGGSAIYYLPGGSSYYAAKSGNIMFKIWYDEDWVDEVAINTDCLNIESLNIPLEVDTAGKSFRYANMKVTFAYSSLIESMLSDIVSNVAKNKTFIDMYIDGSLYWRGLMIWENTSKNDYYIDSSGNVLYKSITFDFNDAFYYLSKNNKTLSNASYSDGIIISSMLENIIAIMGFSSGDLVLDSNLSITEECGTSYDLGDLKITGLDSDTLLTEFLNDFMVEFACFIYILKGKVYVVKRTGGTTLAVSDSSIMALNQSGLNQVGYVNLYISLIATDGWPAYGGADIVKNSGIKNQANTELNYERECTLLKKCFIAGDGDLYPLPVHAPTGGDTDDITDTAAAFLTNLIETGDVLYYNDPVPAKAQSFIMKGISETNLKYYDIGVTVDTGENYWIKNGHFSTPYPRYKGELLLYMVGSAYIDFFLTSSDIFNITLSDISTHDDISNRFVFNSLNHRARNAIINFIDDTINMEWMRVS